MEKRSRRIGIAVALAALLALFVATLAIGSQPSACASCHAMEPYAETLSATAHADVSCYSCHLDDGLWDWPRFKTVELTVMYPAALRGADSVTGPVAYVPDAPCEGCHSDVRLSVTESKGLRIDHGFCAPVGSGCITCHAQTAHAAAGRWERSPIMEECVLCHRDEGGPVACDACHEGRLQDVRLTRGPWQVTHGATWRDTHGLSDLTYCATCHPDDYCVSCHGLVLPHPASFPRTHGQESLQPLSDCESCHDRAACESCHGMVMPHPDSFLPEHSELASGYADPACIACHNGVDCTTCHVKHTHPGTTEGDLRERLEGSQ